MAEIPRITPVNHVELTTTHKVERDGDRPGGRQHAHEEVHDVLELHEEDQTSTPDVNVHPHFRDPEPGFDLRA